IVTEVPGTTRDVIEEYVNVRGVPLRLIDTAGIRETEDIVEKMGVERSRQVLQESDLILFVLNYNDELTEDDRDLFKVIEGFEYIVMNNKTDLEQKLNNNEVKQLAGGNPIVTTSIIEEKGIDQMEEAIARTFFAGAIE